MASSKQEPLLFINTASSSFQAGSEVSGVVFLRIIEDTTCDVVWININGKEFCSLNEIEPSQASSVVTLLNTTASLIKWPNCVAPKGDYTFPFKFTLPENLPGSFGIRSDIRAKLRYRIKAEMLAGTKPCKFSLPIAVRQTVDLRRYTTQHQITEQVRMLCCIKKGQIGIQMKLDKIAYASTDTAKLTVRLESAEMSHPIQSMQCKLVRNASFIINGSVVKTMTDEIFDINLDKLPSKESLLGDSGLDVLIPLSEYQQIIQSTSSTDGTLIRCNFTLLVKCHIGVMFVAPYLSAPLIIYNEDTPSIKLCEIPEDWSPSEAAELGIPVCVIESINKD